MTLISHQGHHISYGGCCFQIDRSFLSNLTCLAPILNWGLPRKINLKSCQTFLSLCKISGYPVLNPLTWGERLHTLFSMCVCPRLSRARRQRVNVKLSGIRQKSVSGTTRYIFQRWRWRSEMSQNYSIVTLTF